MSQLGMTLAQIPSFIGKGAVPVGTSVAFKDVSTGAQMWSNPARDKTQKMRIQGAVRRLPEMQRDLRAVKKKVGQ